jgi:hypothetical protein
VTAGLAALLARIAATRATHADLVAARARLRPPGVLRTSPAGASASGPGAAVVPLPGVAPAPSVAGPSAVPAATPSPSGSPGAQARTLTSAARDALAALTAGEHAAVYAYGLVVAWVAGAERDRARQAWSWHLARRDTLEERLLAAGVQPPAAAPAYAVAGSLSPAAAGTLAATVEDRLATLGARTVATTTDADRADAADGLVAGARRAAAWRGRGVALPG